MFRAPSRVHRRALLGASLVAIAAAGCAVAAKPAPQSPIAVASAPSAERIAEGERLARAHCARCHAVGRDGASLDPAAPPLRALAERYPGALLADAFPQRMKVGHPAMPPFLFNPEEIEALRAYVLAVQERKGA